MAGEATKIPFIEAAAPSTPAASRVVIYAKADGLMYSKDDAGTETLMSAGGGGIPATLLDAKGDLIAASAADTAARLAVGANGTVLSAASGEATGLIWTAFSGARAYNSGTINLNNGSYTTITLDSEYYDTDGYHSTSSNTERMTIAATAKYRFGANLGFTGLTAGNFGYLEIVKNAGPTVLAVATTIGHSSTSSHINASSEAILTASDYLWVRAFVAIGSVTIPANGDWSPVLWIERCMGS